MKIAVLTSKSRFEKFTDPEMIPEGTEIVHIGPEYTDDSVVRQAGDAEVIVVDAVLPVSASLIERMPRLRLIHSEGVSFNLIDLETAARAGVYVCNNRAVNAGQVAEHSVMLILAVMRRLLEGDAEVRAGRQAAAKSRFIVDGLHDLTECSVGLIGFGAIGRELARRLGPFGCRLYYTDPIRAGEELEREHRIEYLERDELLRTCDVVTLHVPVTPETTNLICAKTLRLMKKNAILINCARGLVVNSQDLADAIRSGTIYGAGLDTMEPEPVPADDPLILLPEPYKYRVVFSPHVAGTTLSVFRNAYKNIWSNIAAAEEGRRPVNVVNGI